MRQVANCGRSRRLVLAVLVGSLCLLAPVVAQQIVRAAPSQSVGTASPETGSLKGGRAGGLGVTVRAADYAVYLPTVSRSYRTFINGDFEQGLSGWETKQGPFGGHGSGLSPQVVVFDGGKRALLGTQGDLAAGSIPVGYGSTAQTFTLEKPYLRLQYWAYSYDRAKGETKYFDTFEMSVNRSPGQISDAERNARGCASTMLNPEGMLTISADGLVFCAGRPGTSGQGTEWQTQGWKTVTLDLSAFQGTNVTLHFAIWSREYEAPYHNDQGWFNTWAYVDNVQLTDSP